MEIVKFCLHKDYNCVIVMKRRLAGTLAKDWPHLSAQTPQLLNSIFNQMENLMKN